MNDQIKNKSTNNPGMPAKDTARDPFPGAAPAHSGGAATHAGGTVAAAVSDHAGSVSKAATEAANPAVETKYWEESYSTRPYATPGVRYEEYAPAYRYGWESYGRNTTDDKSFDSVEAELGRGWNMAKGSSGLGWDKAKPATREAWERVKKAAHSTLHA